jgi:hypothetical protein
LCESEVSDPGFGRPTLPSQLGVSSSFREEKPEEKKVMLQVFDDDSHKRLEVTYLLRYVRHDRGDNHRGARNYLIYFFGFVPRPLSVIFSQ